MDFRHKQIAPPKSWMIFEEICHVLFSAIWGDQYALKNGRAGQSQNGVDLYGRPSQGKGGLHGVQCKGKDAAYGHTPTEREVRDELAKAERFRPPLEHWILATTAPIDAHLQKVAREITDERLKEGLFSVTVLGWECIQSLLADHPSIIERFYPEHAFDLPGVIAALRQLPSSSELARFREALTLAKDLTRNVAGTEARWKIVDFSTERDLGPALMGRPLGPADVCACPVLPEAGTIVQELERGYSARLVGIPGAGKSVCALQAARSLSCRGWRVVRLVDPKVDDLTLTDGDRPTLHLVDDAHLAEPALLSFAEHMTTQTKWLLSMHTTFEGQSTSSGAIRLDAKRAVGIIGASLRTARAETLRIVQRADDRVGDRPGEESLEDRFAQAEKAELPWQFCFVLGGGWRRAGSVADSARAASADLVLAAAAIRQLASRDARCRRSDLEPLLAAASVDKACVETAIEWLVMERLLLSRDDLRCPHQRFSAVLLDRILKGQDQDGRSAIGEMLHCVLSDDAMPLAGLRVLLLELRIAGESARWTFLVDHARLAHLLTRCWCAEDLEDRRYSALVLAELRSYMPNWPGQQFDEHVNDVASWINDPAPSAGYGIGLLVNQIFQKDPALAKAIVSRADPLKVATAISNPAYERACDIANMVSGLACARSQEWRQRYLECIDRNHGVRLAATWPRDAYLSTFAAYCKVFVWDDEDFALDLVEAFIPAIADRLQADPIFAFHEIDDIAWHVLRLYDPLGVYVGKRAPTKRMRSVSRRLASCWSPKNLARQLSACTKRDFQKAAGLLLFLHNAARARFLATVSALDWDQLDVTIGDSWRALFHEAEAFLAVCYSAQAVRPQLADLIERNLHRIERMSPKLALIAPKAGFSHVERGGEIALSTFGHFHWDLAAGVLAVFRDERPDLVDALLQPHETPGGATLSNRHASWFKEATTFLRFMRQVAPENFERMLDKIDIASAEEGWANSLRGKSEERQAAAYLVHCAKGRQDDVGDLARSIEKRFPRRAIPSKATLAPLV